MPTVAEIGKLVGCSSATVSRALNNRGSVSAKTREAIAKVMQNFDAAPADRTERRGRPSHWQKPARSGFVEILYFRDEPVELLTVQDGQLSVGPFSTWASPRLLSAHRGVSGSFYRRIIDGITTELDHWDYKAMVQTRKDLLSAESLADVNKPNREGILLMGEYSPLLGDFIRQCKHPVVLVDLILPGTTDVVTTDNYTGINLAFDHIYQLGHRNIGFVGWSNPNLGPAERIWAFNSRMAEVGLTVNPKWIYRGPSRIDQTEEGMAAMLSSPDRPTALICANDCFALGSLRGAIRVNLQIPKDLSIVGFDDDEAASLVTPPLTTVRVPAEEIGHLAVRQLVMQILHPSPVGSLGACVRVRPELIVRRSTRPLS